MSFPISNIDTTDWQSTQRKTENSQNYCLKLDMTRLSWESNAARSKRTKEKRSINFSLKERNDLYDVVK